MKNFLISEIIYWVIAVISLFSVIENWSINKDRAYILEKIKAIPKKKDITFIDYCIIYLYSYIILVIIVLY